MEVFAEKDHRLASSGQALEIRQQYGGSREMGSPANLFKIFTISSRPPEFIAPTEERLSSGLPSPCQPPVSGFFDLFSEVESFAKTDHQSNSRGHPLEVRQRCGEARQIRTLQNLFKTFAISSRLPASPAEPGRYLVRRRPLVNGPLSQRCRRAPPHPGARLPPCARRRGRHTGRHGRRSSPPAPSSSARGAR